MAAKKNPIRFLNERLAGVRRDPPWTAALLVISSAALGGIAVALWNRKALASFRDLDSEEQSFQEPAHASSSEAEDDFY